MSKRKDGDPEVDVDVWNAAVAIHEATNGNILRNLDLHTLEYTREKCALFLARSEKYIRIRQDQSAKSMIASLTKRLKDKGVL